MPPPNQHARLHVFRDPPDLSPNRHRGRRRPGRNTDPNTTTATTTTTGPYLQAYHAHATDLLTTATGPDARTHRPREVFEPPSLNPPWYRSWGPTNAGSIVSAQAFHDLVFFDPSWQSRIRGNVHDAPAEITPAHRVRIDEVDEAFGHEDWVESPPSSPAMTVQPPAAATCTTTTPSLASTAITPPSAPSLPSTPAPSATRPAPAPPKPAPITAATPPKSSNTQTLRLRPLAPIDLAALSDATGSVRRGRRVGE